VNNNFAPSDANSTKGGAKPVYALNLDDPDGRVSPVFKTLEQKTDEFIEMKRQTVEKHHLKVVQCLPLQARIQSWETGLRK